MFHALKLYTIFLYLLEPAVAAKGPLGNPRNCIPLCELLSCLGRRHLHLHPIGQAGCLPWKQIQSCAVRVLKSTFHHLLVPPLLTSKYISSRRDTCCDLWLKKRVGTGENGATKYAWPLPFWKKTKWRCVETWIYHLRVFWPAENEHTFCWSLTSCAVSSLLLPLVSFVNGSGALSRSSHCKETTPRLPQQDCHSVLSLCFVLPL